MELEVAAMLKLGAEFGTCPKRLQNFVD